MTISSPIVSVIIPVYGGADYVGKAIQSVLDQTYQHFEVIIVNDASPDRSAEVIGRFDDQRLKYIEFKKNRGADVARNTAVHASSGEILAFLDQDDYFHPEKLQAHVEFLKKHPDVGLTYNARFELNHSSETIRDIWRPPRVFTLAQFVISHMISPTDMVIRRRWLYEVGLLDDSHDFNGGEFILISQLHFRGCKLASVNRALNYRRYYTDRVFSDLPGQCAAELDAQEKVFSDPRCPLEVVALREIAFSTTYLVLANEAFSQEETSLGQDFIRQAVRLRPSILQGAPGDLIKYFVTVSIADESKDHRSHLKRIFDQLPPEMAWLADQIDWAVARGFLLRGARAIVWDRPDDGYRHFDRAVDLGAKIDEEFVQGLTYQLFSYETEFGAEATQEVLRSLAQTLKKVGYLSAGHKLKGCYFVQRAFQSFNTDQREQVARNIMHAIINDPKYLANRGVLSILVRSTIGT